MTQICECFKKLKHLNISLEENELGETELEGEGYYYDSSLRQEAAVRLPGYIKINEMIPQYPDIENADLPPLFQEMSEVISGTNDYEYNIFSFWLLDVFLEGLKTAQLAGMNHRNQRATLCWIAYLYNTVQGNETKMRRDTLRNLKYLLLLSRDRDSYEAADTSDEGDTIGEDGKESSDAAARRQWVLPFPPVLGSDEVASASEKESNRPSEELDTATEPRSSIEEEEEEEENMGDLMQNIHHMEIILEILYRIFGRLWAFKQLQSAIHSTPTVEVVDLPFKLNVPKQLLKSEGISAAKPEKGGRKSVLTKNFDDSTTCKESSKSDFILPLQAAEGVDNFLRDLFALRLQDSNLVEKDRGRLDKRKK